MPDSASTAVDTEKFRLRRFIERLDADGEVETHDGNVALADISKIVEASDKAVRFKSAGPEKQELVANVMGSRKRLAVALETTVEEVVPTFQARLNNKQPVVHVNRDQAPVQQVVLEGDDADLTKLPFHPQHAFDGSTYISSAIDYAFDADNDVTNVGCRRLSLRNKHECGTNVTAPSDLQRIYRAAVRRGEKLPISFALGSHPIDFMAAGMRIPTDEITLVGTLRGEPVPLVKSLTNDIMVPADAEMVIEGYLDERGYVEPEGPYGEYVGYYGAMHMDPVFRVTAITHREGRAAPDPAAWLGEEPRQGGIGGFNEYPARITDLGHAQGGPGRCPGGSRAAGRGRRAEHPHRHQPAAAGSGAKTSFPPCWAACSAPSTSSSPTRMWIFDPRTIWTGPWLHAFRPTGTSF